MGAVLSSARPSTSSAKNGAASKGRRRWFWRLSKFNKKADDGGLSAMSTFQTTNATSYAPPAPAEEAEQNLPLVTVIDPAPMLATAEEPIDPKPADDNNNSTPVADTSDDSEQVGLVKDQGACAVEDVARIDDSKAEPTLNGVLETSLTTTFVHTVVGPNNEMDEDESDMGSTIVAENEEKDNFSAMLSAGMTPSPSGTECTSEQKDDFNINSKTVKEYLQDASEKEVEETEEEKSTEPDVTITETVSGLEQRTIGGTIRNEDRTPGAAAMTVMSQRVVDESMSDTAVAYGRPFLIRFLDESGDLTRLRSKGMKRRYSITTGIAKAMGGGLKRTFSKVRNFVASAPPVPSPPPRPNPSGSSTPSGTPNGGDQRAGSSVESLNHALLSTGESENSMPICAEASLSSSSSSNPTSTWYWNADESSRTCDIRSVTQTSLLTFHGRRANAINLKGSSRPLEYVENGAIITIYANVGGGRYLCLDPDGSSLRFLPSPADVREDESTSSRCEFIVRRTIESSEPFLMFTDVVRIESIALPGVYLAVNLMTGVLQPVTDAALASSFVLHSPTLRELVHLNAIAGPTTAASAILDAAENDFILEETRAEAEREQAWMDAIAKSLPIDVAKRIFSYHRDWVRTARLVSKEWKAQAELSITHIRVNGEFCSLESPEERRRLVDFVRDCPNLECLTLRNILSLYDEDVAEMAENRNIVAFLVGGCRQLTDSSTRAIVAKLGPKLTKLNLAFTQISDESVRIIARNPTSIKDLNLYQCTQVSAECINSAPTMGSGLKHLLHLNLRGTIVEGHQTMEFRRKMPHVHVLTGPASPDSIYGS